MGHTIVKLTKLDRRGLEHDDVPRAQRSHDGPWRTAIEVYAPLIAGSPTQTVGVLELYLSYQPIATDVAILLHTLYLELGAGLGALYLALFLISASLSRRLGRETDRNRVLATTDSLTTLPNRHTFLIHTGALAQARRATGGSVSVAIVDIDDFKAVNDSLGHGNGDRVISEVGRRLTAECPAGGMICRLGGDEYAIAIPGDDAAATLERMRARIGRDLVLEGLTFAVEASIGFSVFPDDGQSVEKLLQRADVAMFAAKSQHRGVVRYEPSLERYDAASLALVAELRHAIEEDQLVLHYQPKVRPADGSVAAFEALVRWQHPENGLLFPDRFLGLAEQTDVIERITTWVLRRALRDVGELGGRDGLPGGPQVAVNVSARSLGRGALADEVIVALDELGVDPSRLIIEVTETAILADPARAARELERIAAAGVKISLDDFGQGQTSIGHLSRLPIHELKIDRGFVGDMDAVPAHAAIVRSLVELGHNLGFQVVAEGVETEVTAEMLEDCGADLLQGYLISRPMPLAGVTEWLRERAATSAAADAGAERSAPETLTA